MYTHKEQSTVYRYMCTCVAERPVIKGAAVAPVPRLLAVTLH